MYCKLIIFYETHLQDPILDIALDSKNKKRAVNQ